MNDVQALDALDSRPLPLCWRTKRSTSAVPSQLFADEDDVAHLALLRGVG
jgi:hypothetical protein